MTGPARSLSLILLAFAAVAALASGVPRHAQDGAVCGGCALPGLAADLCCGAGQPDPERCSCCAASERHGEPSRLSHAQPLPLIAPGGGLRPLPGRKTGIPPV